MLSCDLSVFFLPSLIKEKDSRIRYDNMLVSMMQFAKNEIVYHISCLALLQTHNFICSIVHNPEDVASGIATS